MLSSGQQRDEARGAAVHVYDMSDLGTLFSGKQVKFLISIC